jgi:DNA-binding transcriptional MerR regulator
MRMAELSAESGMPVATIKYYLREGLLPAGERTSPNQARYGAEHVQRLKTIRALTEVGGLPLASVRAVLAAMEEENTPHKVMGVVQRELVPLIPDVPPEHFAWARETLAEIVGRHGWGELDLDKATVLDVVATLARYRELVHELPAARLEEYVQLAMRVAEVDLSTTADGSSVERIIEITATAMVLGDHLFTGLRHLAQAVLSREVLGSGSPGRPWDSGRGPARTAGGEGGPDGAGGGDRR